MDYFIARMLFDPPINYTMPAGSLWACMSLVHRRGEVCAETVGENSEVIRLHQHEFEIMRFFDEPKPLGMVQEKKGMGE